ncbi:hypothetical protein BT96DRAFT_941271 [Gymnopus androsaceus JB14]|uniref:DNA breaking-rejoining enzyme n=1 Tax=Gymnopus androsaceus JB14 TaxID=1447944 RepID=A0A6A4HH31_9AGAR|nr:hypothetical protein BT96DRAFT_941271 [Gymnopus androsaceus JB14]
MDAAVLDKTRQRKLQYTSEFLVWAAEQGLTEEDVLPPSKATLCNFAASFAGKLAGGTAKAKVSAVKGWVQRRGLAWEGGNNLRNRPPVKKEHLSTLFDELDLTGSCGLDHAMAAVSAGCFYGQLRGGEILPQSSNPADFNPSHLPTVKDLKAPNENSDRKLRLPKTKTKQSRGKEVVYSPQPGRTSPTRAWREHIRVNRLGPDDPLVAYWDENDELKHNIPCMTGHCFRIGGMTHYLVQGIPPDVVKMLGRWKSDVFLKYWRDLDSLASIHLHRHHAQVSYTNRLQDSRAQRHYAPY